MKIGAVFVRGTLAIFIFFLALSCTKSDAGNQSPTPAKLSDRTLKIKSEIKSGSFPKIVGGEEAATGEFRWAVALVIKQADGTFFQYCRGALIAEKWVLTAAHCEVKATDNIIIGRHSLNSTEGKVFGISEIKNHKSYNSSTHDFDIALIKVNANPAELPSPIVLINPGSNLDAVGIRVTVIGWGRLSENGPTSHTLQKVTVPIVSNNQCEQNYRPTLITENMMCAGYDQGQKDSCQGDNGGPLMVLDPNGE